MKSPDQLWQQLITAARHAPARPVEPSWGRVERILHQWQTEQAEENASAELTAWMGRRVLLGALLVMTATLALCYLPLDDTWTALSASAPWLEVVSDL